MEGGGRGAKGFVADFDKPSLEKSFQCKKSSYEKFQCKNVD